jgi:hypothetical protein
MKLGMYVNPPKHISTAYFINPSYQYVYTPHVARQRLGKNIAVETNTYSTIE